MTLQRIRQSGDPGESLTERYVLKGDAGAVQFVYMRPIIETYPESEREAVLAKFPPSPPLPEAMDWLAIPDPVRDPWAVDLGVHRPKLSRGEFFETCEYLGGPCYYEGSSLPARRYLDLLLQDGEEALWRALEAFYVKTFGGKDGRDEEDGPSRAGA